jgi:hypothetical protein
MHLASLVFDVVTARQNVTDEVRRLIPDIDDDDHLPYWRSAIRMAALCHDIGHLPFSHAAEKQLLPREDPEWNHERLSRGLILDEEMSSILKDMTPPLRPLEVAKLAIGKDKAPDLEFSPWEEILSDIITGDVFGVDRMDYLLRDSLHAGVEYGQFDYRRLAATLRVLPSPPQDEQDEERGFAGPASLGVQVGGLHAAEALLLSRYLMYSQVYLHSIRRVYDLHLIEFLRNWLPGGVFSTELETHLSMTDNEVLAGILRTGFDESQPGHDAARRVQTRDHFRRLYTRTPQEFGNNPEVVAKVGEEFEGRFGPGTSLSDEPRDTKPPPDFPVLTSEEAVVSGYSLSAVLKNMPVISLGYVFVRPDLLDEGRKWLEENRQGLTAPIEEPEEGDRG